MRYYIKRVSILCISILSYIIIANPASSEVYVLNVSEDLDVIIDGPILPGDDSKFQHIVDTYGPRIARVVLNSPGGSVPDGLGIAELVYSRKLDTSVPDGDYCLSACFYIFSAGEKRNADGAVGVHQMSIPGDNRGDISVIQTYLSKVTRIINNSRIDPTVLDIMLATAPSDIYVFNKDELSKFNIGLAANLAPVLPDLKSDDVPKYLSLLPREFGLEKFHARYRHNGNGSALEIDADFSVRSVRMEQGVVRQTYSLTGARVKNAKYAYVYDAENSPVFNIYYDKAGKITKIELEDDGYFELFDSGLPFEEKLLSFLFPVYVIEPFLGVHGWFNDRMPIDDVYKIEKSSGYIDELKRAILSSKSYTEFKNVLGQGTDVDARFHRFFDLFRRYEQFLPNEVATADPLKRQRGYLIPFSGTNRANALSRDDGFTRRTYVTTVSGSINTRTAQIDGFTGGLTITYDDGVRLFESVIDISPRD